MARRLIQTLYSITYTGRLGLSAGFLFLANTVSKVDFILKCAAKIGRFGRNRPKFSAGTEPKLQCTSHCRQFHIQVSEDGCGIGVQGKQCNITRWVMKLVTPLCVASFLFARRAFCHPQRCVCLLMTGSRRSGPFLLPWCLADTTLVLLITVINQSIKRRG